MSTWQELQEMVRLEGLYSYEGSKFYRENAFHEAGHSLYLGMSSFYNEEFPFVTEVSIIPKIKETIEESYAAITKYRLQGYFPPQYDVQFSLAGPAAEYVGGLSPWFNPASPKDGWRDDIKWAEDSISKLNPESTLDGIFLCLDTAYSTVVSFLEENKKALEAIANELLYKGTIPGSRVYAIVGHHITKKELNWKKFIDSIPPAEAWPDGCSLGQGVEFLRNWKPQEEVLRERWLSEK